MDHLIAGLVSHLSSAHSTDSSKLCFILFEISAFSKIFLLEKVMLVAIFFVLILRRYNESDDFENDHEDDGKAINKSFKEDNVSPIYQLSFSSSKIRK
jgi:hypothetical protein